MAKIRKEKILVIIFILFITETCIDKTSSHQIYKQMIKDVKNSFVKNYGEAYFFKVECGPIILLAKQIKPIRDKQGKIIRYDETCSIYHSKMANWIPLIYYKLDGDERKMIFDIFLEHLENHKKR